MRRIYRRVVASVNALLFALAASQAFAQGYPTGPIQVVVPFPAGGYLRWSASKDNVRVTFICGSGAF